MLNLLDAWFKMNVGDAAFYSVFGLVFVVVGITVLVLILMLIGFIMKKVTAKKAAKEEAALPPTPRMAETEDEKGISPETVAAITAALMAFYEEENIRCDFVVRRIKRL